VPSRFSDEDVTFASANIHTCNTIIGSAGPTEPTRATAKMGIKQLFSIIRDEAPEAIKEGEIKNQFGRKVAIVSCPHAINLVRINLSIGCVRTNIFRISCSHIDMQLAL
jgi:hypothetical protein